MTFNYKRQRVVFLPIYKHLIVRFTDFRELYVLFILVGIRLTGLEKNL